MIPRREHVRIIRPEKKAGRTPSLALFTSDTANSDEQHDDPGDDAYARPAIWQRRRQTQVALDIKVLRENHEEIEIKIQDDEMSKPAKDIGLFVGSEPMMSQIQIVAREVKQQRLAAAAVAASGLEDGGELPPMEDDEEEDIGAHR